MSPGPEVPEKLLHQELCDFLRMPTGGQVFVLFGSTLISGLCSEHSVLLFPGLRTDPMADLS